jgi:hypothetical protein
VIATIPAWLQIFGEAIGVIVGIATLIGLLAVAVLLARSAKARANNTLADSAVNSLTAANAGLSSRLDLVEQENAYCLELKKQQDVVILQQDKRISDLRDWVTARDLITDLGILLRAGFEALDVPASKLPAPVIDPRDGRARR